MSPPLVTPFEEVADLRVEVERERGLRLAAEREVQAITAHLTTAQATIRMIEAAPPKVETRIERVEVEKPVEVPVPVTPRWVWPVIIAGLLLVILASVVAGWLLTHRPEATPAPQATTSSTHQPAGPTPPTSTTSPDDALQPVLIDPPTRS